MADTPYMPLWVADFIGDTMDLDAREVGAYMLILMVMWKRGGSLPHDARKLRRIARIDRSWNKVWAALEPYFEVRDGRIYNRRLTEELEKVEARREINARNGALGGRAKARRQAAGEKADPTSLLPGPEAVSADPAALADRQIPAPAPDNDRRSERRSALLGAMGLPDAAISPSGTVYGGIDDMYEASRWESELGLSLDEQVAVIRDVMARKRDGPPTKFRYFTRAMQRYAAEKKRPALQSDGGTNGRSGAQPPPATGDAKSRALKAAFLA